MLTWDFERIRQKGKFFTIGKDIAVCKDTQPINEFQFFHKHTFYELTYVYTGKGILNFENSSYTMEEGFLSLTAPDEAHVYTATDNLQIANICFVPNAYQKSILSKLPTRIFSLSAPLANEYELLFTLLENAIGYSENDLKATNYLNTILSNLLIDPISPLENEEPWIHFFPYVRKNLTSITLQDAAQFCSFSVGHFCRIFRKNFSCTFNQYLDILRLNQAKELLLSTKLNVNEISAMVGFSHPTRFYRLFQEKEGITPNQYRKNQ